MKRAFLFVMCLVMALSAEAQTAADLNEGLQVTTGAQAGDFTVSWWGKTGRTYFVQQSFDLMTWQYVPVVMSGAEDVSGLNFSCSETRQFWRLRYTDQSTGGNAETADFDGDQVSNLLEAQNNTDPFSNVDTDGDGLPDDWEVAAGANAADPYDMLLDADGDRIPNLYEFAHGTNGWDAGSHLPPHITVDPTISSGSQTATLKKTITNAISAASSSVYTVIRIKPGIYDELVNTSTKSVLLLGDTDGDVVLSRSSDTMVDIRQRDVVLRDLQIVAGTWQEDRPVVSILLDAAGEQMAMVNCIVRSTGICARAPLQIQRGTTIVSQCTIAGNFTGLDSIATDPLLGMAGGISLYSPSYSASHQKLVLRRSILWNPSSHPPVEIFARSGSTVLTEDNLVRGGQYGGLDADPLLDRYGMLLPGSPALRGGSAGTMAIGDIHGESHNGLPDLGADEFQDSDTDDLPDWWEMRHFGNLTTASGGSDNDSPAGDGLINRWEYLLGFDPLNPNSGGDPAVSDQLAALQMAWDAYYPDAWHVDADGDGLHAGWEAYLDTSDSSADSNGDGISDLATFLAGLNPAATDLDGDGLDGAAELALGTSALSADTDGDGVNDDIDPFPLDPFQWTPLVSDPGDTTGPLVVLEKPAEALLVP